MRQSAQPRLVYLVAFVLLAACSHGAEYDYWQVTGTADGRATGPEKLITVTRDQPPSEQDPIEVAPKPVEGAVKYTILRAPASKPAAPEVEVVNKGANAFYYWLVGHAGLLRSPIAGPAEAKDCDASNLKNVVRWRRTDAYDAYSVLRTDTPEVPSGVMHVLAAWGVNGEEITDTRGQTMLADYPCYPDGAVAGRAPAGSGSFLVGTSDGAPVKDTGKLTTVLVKPAARVNEKRPHSLEIVNPDPKAAMELWITNDQPNGNYGWGGPVGLYIDQTDYAGGHNDYTQLDGGPHVKSFHIPFWIWQHNFTFGQVANQVIYSEKHGEGDSAILVAHTTTDGLVEDGGDEGTEVFMCSAGRKLTFFNYVLAEDAPKHSALLKVEGGVKRTGAGRVVVNLSRVEKRGVIVRVDDDMKIDPDLPDGVQANRVTRLTGEGTHWTPAMTGWYISLDCDTRDDGIRQWYRIMRVNSPASLDIFAYTYFSSSTYLGHARNVTRHGAKYRAWAGDKGIKHEPRPSPDPKASPEGRETFIIAPATTVADPSLLGSDLNVMPLKEDWKKGDQIRVIAGPQNSVSIGKMAVKGEFLPQDWAHGLWVYNWSDRLSNGGALIIMGRWSKGIEIMLDEAGLSDGVKVTGKAAADGGAFVAPPDTTALRVSDVPVVLAGRSETGELVFSEGTHDGDTILALGAKRVTVGKGAVLKGSDRMRGRAVLSGDGKTRRFAIAFPSAHDQPPYVVASANLPIGMAVEGVTAGDFAVTFAEAPPAGTDNVIVTWMAME